MKKHLFLLFLAILLVSCTTASASESGPGRASQAPVKQGTETVVAEGVVQPMRWSALSLTMPGEVIEVSVKPGERVEAGAPLIRLDTDALTLALQSAEQDVLIQQAALQQLLDGASPAAIARTDKANADTIVQAEVLLTIKQLQLERSRAEDPAAAVAVARAQARQAELVRAQAQAQDPAPAVALAQVELERARIALSDTQNEYNKAIDRPWEDQKIRDGWAKQLEQARLNTLAAQARLDSALNSQKAYEFGLDVLAVQMEEARAQLTQAVAAQQAYSITVQMLEAEVQAATLSLNALKKNDNPYKDKASDEQVAQARALVEKARLAVAQIEEQLQSARLTAPFAGAVTDVSVEVGDRLAPGQTVVMLATLDWLEIRTTDLTELNIAQVKVGQAAAVMLDALPGHEWMGAVTEISLQSQDYRGDVVYEVIIALDGAQDSELLRWGMTTLVKIQVR